MRASREQTVQVGDWVQSYSPGIWQVVRVLAGFWELRYHLRDRKRRSRRTVVFVKRIVDARWQKAFMAESCDIAHVRRLADPHREQLRNLLASDPGMLTEFDAYPLADLDFLMALTLKLPESQALEQFESSVLCAFDDIRCGLTNDEVLERLESSGVSSYVSHVGGNAMIRFVCENHELRDDQFVFRSVGLTPI